MTKKQYLDAECCNSSDKARYIAEMGSNYIVLNSGSSPRCWAEGLPVVYGDKASALQDCLPGDTIITEEEFYNEYLTN